MAFGKPLPVQPLSKNFTEITESSSNKDKSLENEQPNPVITTEIQASSGNVNEESETVTVLAVLNDNESNINLAPASRNTSTVSLQLSGHDSVAVATTSITDKVQVTTIPTHQSDWSQWSPAQLKRPKSKPFRKSATLCDTSSINGLAAAKMELATLQAALVAAETTHKEAEHTIKIKNLTSENNSKLLLLGEELKLKQIQSEVQAEILEGLKLDNKKKRQDLLHKL
ncbi:hypothetical protein RN001_003773 [Aquatica leii]|uniref:Uncharacterized protein n=1 Tax=Aquatica leii TaxID=1421715 RepID=A0AAN7PIT9_9COLE|nr:hypothetical protein RN001_003773 [Aquatica leii]